MESKKSCSDLKRHSWVSDAVLNHPLLQPIAPETTRKESTNCADVRSLPNEPPKRAELLPAFKDQAWPFISQEESQ